MASAAALRTAWSRVISIPVQHPFAFGVGLSCVKTSFSDLLVQKIVERKEEIDWKRNMAFASFGFFYLGGVQYAIYVPFFGRLFPGAAKFAAKPLREKLKDFKGMIQLGAQVFLDQCVHHPLMYFPAFYCTKELVMSEKPDFFRVLKKYRENMMEDLFALWQIWMPATIVNFAFMPMYARIPFVAGVSLLWTCILSAMRGGDIVHGEDLAGGAVTGATLTILEEGFVEFFQSPVDLDKNSNHFCITASGPDKAGWVALLARTLADEGANVTYSRMVRLGNDFIILMHVAIPPEKTRSLLNGLKSNAELKPLNVRATNLSRRPTGMFERPKHGLRIHCMGEDR
jgi:predicted amino acid-binding ACT domain protein